MFQRALKKTTARMMSHFARASGELPLDIQGRVMITGEEEYYHAAGKHVTDITRRAVDVLTKEPRGNVREVKIDDDQNAINVNMRLFFDETNPNQGGIITLKQGNDEQISHLPGKVDSQKLSTYIASFFKECSKTPEADSVKLARGICTQAAKGVELDRAFEDAGHTVSRRRVRY
jgi:hypothetical protein